MYRVIFFFYFFFFQAEDGIRDLTVTGVQTCALPISEHFSRSDQVHRLAHQFVSRALQVVRSPPGVADRKGPAPGYDPVSVKNAPALPRKSDRKSTRLNSSHSQISYAVFCLKKKKKIRHIQHHIRVLLL